MSAAVGRLRDLAARARRRLWPSPAVAAWRRLEAEAAQRPRYTPGRVRLMDLDLEYADAASLAPQWHDLFVRETLAFEAGTASPRILDCGANVGLAALWLKRRYPGARITAYEADPALAAMCARNLARNGAADVELIAAAVWREAGTVAFRCEGADSGAVEVVAADTPGAVERVPAVRLRDVVAREPVDLLKLDIEGAELAVLEDLAGCWASIRAIHLEVHDFDPRLRRLPRCLLLLEQAGYVVALDDLFPATWRPSGAPCGPFRRAVPSWVVLVRAWRTS